MPADGGARMTDVLCDRFFLHLCEGLGFICIAVDSELRIQFWNAPAREQFGEAMDGMAGRSVLDLLSESDRDAARMRFARVLADRCAEEMEIKYPRSGRHPKTFVMIISPIVDENGACVGASAAMRDISERKRLSRELAQSRQMGALGRMAGAVAHHFNNILGGMLTSVDYALTSDSPRELRRTLRLLAREIGRATRITNQLAAFAESENEQAEQAELNDLLETFLKRVRPRARSANVRLETPRIDTVASARFEARRLLPVLDSLVQNAFDAMPEGGTLTLSMTEEAGEAVIRIEDSGCGIPEHLQERLFEPFFTTKGELAGGGGGNIGLGLAAVHGLVAEMGGTIRITSQVSEGTQIVLRLPLHRETRTAGGRAPSEQGEAAGGASPDTAPDPPVE